MINCIWWITELYCEQYEIECELDNKKQRYNAQLEYAKILKSKKEKNNIIESWFHSSWKRKAYFHTTKKQLAERSWLGDFRLQKCSEEIAAVEEKF